MIANCRSWLMSGQHHEALWEREPTVIIPMLEYCLTLNNEYHEQYRATRESLVAIPKGKQLDLSEQEIFSRMDLFCRRLQKLITMVDKICLFFPKRCVQLCEATLELTWLETGVIVLCVWSRACDAFGSTQPFSSSRTLVSSDLKGWMYS